MINTQNIDDNECFKWSIVRYVYPANHHLARITKRNKEFAKNLILRTKNIPSKLETFTKLENKQTKRIPLALVFLAMKIQKNIHSMYQKKVVKKHILIYS